MSPPLLGKVNRHAIAQKRSKSHLLVPYLIWGGIGSTLLQGTLTLGNTPTPLNYADCISSSRRDGLGLGSSFHLGLLYSLTP